MRFFADGIHLMGIFLVDFFCTLLEGEVDKHLHISCQVPRPPKIYFDYCPTGFMNNHKWRQALLNIINNIEMNIIQQLDLENIYKQIINTITVEMETHLKFKDCAKKSKQKIKTYKTILVRKTNTSLEGNEWERTIIHQV